MPATTCSSPLRFASGRAVKYDWNVRPDLAYAFQITPRRKRPGLIQGEIWLDQGTGVPVRQIGRLVKSPSAVIRRVSVIRENALREGIVESRLTHIKVEIRSIGHAELVIEERPLRSPDYFEFGEFDTL